MSSEKFYKQVQLICILLFVCVVINFVFSFVGAGAGIGRSDSGSKAELANLHSQIDLLEREISSLSDYVADMELVASGESKDKSIALLETALAQMETRLKQQETSAAGATPIAIANRVEQLEMKLSTLEIAFKQVTGATGAKPTATAANNKPTTNTKPTSTTTNTKPSTTTKPTAAANSGGSKPIQIQTGSGAGGGTAVATNSKFHTVQTGETLFRISRTYGITVDQLRKMNNLKENDVIKPGQRLIVGQ